VQYQLDTEKQIYDYYEPGHNYAWTNTYLIDVPSDADAQLWLMRLIGVEAAVLPEDTSIRFACWRRGIGGPVPAGVQFIGQSGLLPSPYVYMPFPCTARISGYSGSRLVWYKRWRGPLRDTDMTGELLTSDYVALLNTAYVAALAGGFPLITRSGARISHWYVDPRVMLWQMRDGTERTRRSVLAG